jgi:hypothetical protein
VSWISGTPGVATVSVGGLVTPVAEGATTVTVTKGSIVATAEITVTAAELVSISLTPDAPSTPLGLTIQMIATGTYTDGGRRALSDVSWTSVTTSVATVSSGGLVTPVAEGTTTVQATAGGLAAVDIELRVRPAEMTTIELRYRDVLKVNTTSSISVTGVYTDGTKKDITYLPLEYTSGNDEIVKFQYGSQSGSMLAVGPGSTRILVHVPIEYGGITANAPMQVVASTR